MSLLDIRNNSKETLSMLDWSYKRIVMPHRAKVSLSDNVFYIKDTMCKKQIMQMKKI